MLFQVKGMVKKEVRNEEEALSLFFEGENARATAMHELNTHSSRSHCIYTVHLEISSGVAGDEQVTVSKLNCVDLAGSERTKKTEQAQKK